MENQNFSLFIAGTKQELENLIKAGKDKQGLGDLITQIEDQLRTLPDL